MSEHSPGPWRWSDERAHVDDQPALMDASGERVCWFGDSTQYYPTAGEPPSQADARLIEAAPELLAALRIAVHSFDVLWATGAILQPSLVDQWRDLVRRIEGEP